MLASMVTAGGPSGDGDGGRSAMAAVLQPTLFIGHGSPLNALGTSRWAEMLRRCAATLPRPRAVLAISAHWYGPGSFVTAHAHPPTIHDFSGFPAELSALTYPAPGDPGLADRVCALSGGQVRPSRSHGLDHGTWSVLVHCFPAADVPVVQLSLDSGLDVAGHLALAARLRPLREAGVLILGSGNITHNLAQAMRALRAGDDRVPDWARRFDASIAEALRRHAADRLGAALASPDGVLAHPSPDHFLPLCYALGASTPQDAVQFPIEGFDLGSLSMRSVRFG